MLHSILFTLILLRCQRQKRWGACTHPLQQLQSCPCRKRMKLQLITVISRSTRKWHVIFYFAAAAVVLLSGSLTQCAQVSIVRSRGTVGAEN
jgi:hypothetical protein